MKRISRQVLALMACFCIAHGALASAQTTTGRISGTVADASGAVLPGVTVTATNEGTGLTRTTTTDGQGAYVFVNLPIGSYTVKTELAGFKSGVKSGYSFAITKTDAAPAAAPPTLAQFYATGVPTTTGGVSQTGTRRFAIAEDGVMHGDTTLSVPADRAAVDGMPAMGN